MCLYRRLEAKNSEGGATGKEEPMCVVLEWETKMTALQTELHHRRLRHPQIAAHAAASGSLWGIHRARPYAGDGDALSSASKDTSLTLCHRLLPVIHLHADPKSFFLAL